MRSSGMVTSGDHARSPSLSIGIVRRRRTPFALSPLFRLLGFFGAPCDALAFGLLVGGGGLGGGGLVLAAPLHALAFGLLGVGLAALAAGAFGGLGGGVVL